MKKFYVGCKGLIRDKGRGILLLHREYKSGDFWDVPGGRIDEDEDIEQTLIRELNEGPV
jgi:8-oxo-dGTP pyrophosphatase MutT (NUDIX family)